MAFTIDDQALIALSLPFDTKLCNYWVDGTDGDVGMFVIDTIPEYLSRINQKYRVAEIGITVLLPKTGTPAQRCDNIPATISTLLANFEGKQYAFIGGLDDENFKEILYADAPADTKPYGRKDKTWVEVAALDHTHDFSEFATYDHVSQVADDLIEYLENGITSSQAYQDERQDVITEELRSHEIENHEAIDLKLNIANPTATGIMTTPELVISGLANTAHDGYLLKQDAAGNVYAESSTVSDFYKGTWDASTNTPQLRNISGGLLPSGSLPGWYYRCAVAGTVNFGAGDIAFAVRDEVKYNGENWEFIKGVDYILETATATVLGGVKIGEELTITAGVLSITDIGNQALLFENNLI